eukprot:3428012-Prymnesium_polylepis.3
MAPQNRRARSVPKPNAPIAEQQDPKLLKLADWLRNEKKSGLTTKEAVQYEKVRRDFARAGQALRPHLRRTRRAAPARRYAGVHQRDSPGCCAASGSCGRRDTGAFLGLARQIHHTVSAQGRVIAQAP